MKFSEADLDKEAVLPDESGMATGTNEDGTNLETGKKEESAISTPAEATAAKETKEQTPSPAENKVQDEDKLPFHKHPAWQRREEEWNKKLDETKAEYESRMQALEAKLPPPPKELKIPDFFKKVYGDDPELYKEWQEQQQADAQRIKDEAKAEILAEQQAEIQAREAEDKRWTNWVETSIQTLKDEGKTFDDNRLKAIAIKHMPTDLEGNIDFRKAYEIMQLEDKAANATAKEKINIRKEIAAQTESTPKGESVARDYLTHDDIRKGASNL